MRLVNAGPLARIYPGLPCSRDRILRSKRGGLPSLIGLQLTIRGGLETDPRPRFVQRGHLSFADRFCPNVFSLPSLYCRPHNCESMGLPL